MGRKEETFKAVILFNTSIRVDSMAVQAQTQNEYKYYKQSESQLMLINCLSKLNITDNNSVNDFFKFEKPFIQRSTPI